MVNVVSNPINSKFTIVHVNIVIHNKIWNISTKFTPSVHIKVFYSKYTYMCNTYSYSVIWPVYTKIAYISSLHLRFTTRTIAVTLKQSHCTQPYLTTTKKKDKKEKKKLNLNQAQIIKGHFKHC